MMGREEMADGESAAPQPPAGHVWGIRGLTTLFALCGLASLYQTVIVWSVAGPVVLEMSPDVWLTFGLAGLYGPLFLLCAWFCARRSRYAVFVYGCLALLWVSSTLTNYWLRGWRFAEPDAWQLGLVGLALTVLPWFYLNFLRSRHWLR